MNSTIIFHVRLVVKEIVVANTHTVRIENIPEDAMEAFRIHAKAKKTPLDVLINWCVDALGYAHSHRTGTFYWQPDGVEDWDAEELPTDGIFGGKVEHLTMNFTKSAYKALLAVEEKLGCGNEMVLARAACLAPYFERRGGVLLFGTIRNGKHLHRLSVVVIRPN